MPAFQPSCQRTLGSTLSSRMGIENTVDCSYWNCPQVWITLETVPDPTGHALLNGLVVTIVWLVRTIAVLCPAVNVMRVTILLGDALHLDVDHGWHVEVEVEGRYRKRLIYRSRGRILRMGSWVSSRGNGTWRC
jgi:hypothetical protein